MFESTENPPKTHWEVNAEAQLRDFDPLQRVIIDPVMFRILSAIFTKMNIIVDALRVIQSEKKSNV